MIKKETLLKHYENLESLKEQAKSYMDDLKDAQSAFAKEYDLDLKALKGDFKKYLDYQKNKQEFLAVDSEMDALTQSWCAEFQTADETLEVK